MVGAPSKELHLASAKSIVNSSKSLKIIKILRKVDEIHAKSLRGTGLEVVDAALHVHLATRHLLPHHGAVLQQEVDGVEDVPRGSNGL